MAAHLERNTLGHHHLVQLLPVEPLDVEPLQLLAGLGVEDGLGGLAGDLLEHGSVILRLKVPVDELLHLGELQGRVEDNQRPNLLESYLVQSSPRARLDDTFVH